MGLRGVAFGVLEAFLFWARVSGRDSFLNNRVDEGRLEENWPVSKRGVAENVVKKLNKLLLRLG